jgi:ribose transport system substrate-binding protein
VRDRRAECRARRPRRTVGATSPFIASVGYSPERYGEAVIDVPGRGAVPPAVFIKHHLVTRDHVDHLYPNDALMGVERYARF